MKPKLIASYSHWRKGWEFDMWKNKTLTNQTQPGGCAEPLHRAFCQFITGPGNLLMINITSDDKARCEKKR